MLEKHVNKYVLKHLTDHVTSTCDPKPSQNMIRLPQNCYVFNSSRERGTNGTFLVEIQLVCFFYKLKYTHIKTRIQKGLKE